MTALGSEATGRPPSPVVGARAGVVGASGGCAAALLTLPEDRSDPPDGRDKVPQRSTQTCPRIPPRGRCFVPRRVLRDPSADRRSQYISDRRCGFRWTSSKLG